MLTTLATIAPGGSLGRWPEWSIVLPELFAGLAAVAGPFWLSA